MAPKAKNKDGTPRKAPKPAVPIEEFVTTWQECESLNEAREKLGEGCSSRAKRLRDFGVKLKEFERAAHRIDVDALNALIEG